MTVSGDCGQTRGHPETFIKQISILTLIHGCILMYPVFSCIDRCADKRAENRAGSHQLQPLDLSAPTLLLWTNPPTPGQILEGPAPAFPLKPFTLNCNQTCGGTTGPPHPATLELQNCDRSCLKLLDQINASLRVMLLLQ